jgi:hypothetical protein
MINIKERPYVLLLLTAITLFIAFTISKIAHLDFLDKMMFSVPLPILIWIIPLFLIFLWLLYLLAKRFLYSTTLSWIHILMTVSTTILIVIFLFIGIAQGQSGSDIYTQTSSTNRQDLIGNATQILFLIFVCGQITYLANVILGLFKKSSGQISA